MEHTVPPAGDLKGLHEEYDLIWRNTEPMEVVVATVNFPLFCVTADKEIEYYVERQWSESKLTISNGTKIPFHKNKIQDCWHCNMVGIFSLKLSNIVGIYLSDNSVDIDCDQMTWIFIKGGLC